MDNLSCGNLCPPSLSGGRGVAGGPARFASVGFFYSGRMPIVIPGADTFQSASARNPYRHPVGIAIGIRPESLSPSSRNRYRYRAEYGARCSTGPTRKFRSMPSTACWPCCSLPRCNANWREKAQHQPHAGRIRRHPGNPDCLPSPSRSTQGSHRHLSHPNERDSATAILAPRPPALLPSRPLGHTSRSL